VVECVLNPCSGAYFRYSVHIFHILVPPRLPCRQCTHMERPTGRCHLSTISPRLQKTTKSETASVLTFKPWPASFYTLTVSLCGPVCYLDHLRNLLIDWSVQVCRRRTFMVLLLTVFSPEELIFQQRHITLTRLSCIFLIVLCYSTLSSTLPVT